MNAYELEPWHEFFVMVGGASAALAGLLFVAVSLNLEHVLKYRALPTLAAQSVSMLVAMVVASAFALAPQSVVAYGIELLAVAVVVAAALFVPLLRRSPSLPGDRLGWKAWRVTAAGIVTVPLAVCGVSLLLGAGGGMYWALAWVVVALIVATFNAWVLLVEIRR